MRTPKYYLYLTDEEYSLVLQSLVSLKNNLIREDRYTDAVDELIIKLSKAKKKKVRNRQISRRMDTHGIIVVERFATFHYY